MSSTFTFWNGVTRQLFSLLMLKQMLVELLPDVELIEVGITDFHYVEYSHYLLPH